MCPSALPGVFLKRNQQSHLFLGSCTVNTVVLWEACLPTPVTFAGLSIFGHEPSNYVGNFTSCLWRGLPFLLTTWFGFNNNTQAATRNCSCWKEESWVRWASTYGRWEFQDFSLFLWNFCSVKPTHIFKDKYTAKNWGWSSSVLYPCTWWKETHSVTEMLLSLLATWSEWFFIACFSV